MSLTTGVTMSVGIAVIVGNLTSDISPVGIDRV